ncbi:MAG: hypothetical protein ACXWC1_28365, partial [Burkholderiales bacterium]
MPVSASGPRPPRSPLRSQRSPRIACTTHPQYRRGRAAAESVIPVEIDLHQSLERLLPPLKGRIAALSTRVPVTNGA